MPCKHADKMMIYAKQAAEIDEPWKLWECRNNLEIWFKCSHHPNWTCDEYRQIPKTININGHEVPEPMREKPEIESRYWFVDPVLDDFTHDYYWADDETDNLLLSRGLCHTTKEAAIAHAKALFSFTEMK